MATNYIAYFRVSTQKQGITGLGIEAQKMAVAGYAANIVAEYVEVESGKKNNRIELQKAIAECKATGATLLIAKLDRLSRNAIFILTLKDSGVNFICADMPQANTLTIGIMAVMAQHEREIISSRTKAALQAKKARAGKIHNNKGNKGAQNFIATDARAKAKEALKVKRTTNANTRQAAAMAVQMHTGGATLRSIANALNNAGFKTATGAGMYSAIQVSRLLTLQTATA